MIAIIRRLDASLLASPRLVQYVVIAATLLGMLFVAVSEVPEQYGRDTIAGMYASRVILNDPSDMYTRALDQTPLEAATWSKQASSPYPPVTLLSQAALYAIGEASGIGFYGAVLVLAAVFIGLVLAYCLQTRWYVFPLLFGNFVYFGHRFVAVQDVTYLIMLTVVMVALLVAHRAARNEARGGSTWAHTLVALAITIKLSPAYYLKNVCLLPGRTVLIILSILVAGLVLPIAIWDDYLSIYSFHEEFKGSTAETIGAIALSVPFALCLWYVEHRLKFDWEDRIGWGIVPFALFLGFKMNTARHLLIVLLIPDKRGLRSAALAVGLLMPVILPGIVRFNSTLAITAGLLVLTLVYYLHCIGWSQVRHDLAHPAATIRSMLRT